jgi:hypothetical protein
MIRASTPRFPGRASAARAPARRFLITGVEVGADAFLAAVFPTVCFQRTYGLGFQCRLQRQDELIRVLLVYECC